MGQQAKWRKFSKEEVEQFVKDSTSFAQLGEKLGYTRTGGQGIVAAKAAIGYHNLDISHFTGQGWNKDNFDYTRFQKGKAIKSANMVSALVALRGHKCEKCQNTEWLGEPIVLEVHHKDGDHLNNEQDNLELLCPNCHSLTENWRGKNISKQNNKKVISEEDFVKALQSSKSIRQALLSLGLTGAGANYERAYNFINKYNITHLK